MFVAVSCVQVVIKAVCSGVVCSGMDIQGMDI